MTTGFTIQTLPDLLARVAERKAAIEWVWDGYLVRGQITILTSLWKSGKTTLLAELLRAVGAGEPCLGRATIKGSAVVLTEELSLLWAARHAARPLPDTLALATHGRYQPPTRYEWIEFLASLGAKPPDLFVIDPLANVLPAHAENSGPAALDFLQELRRFACHDGPAILLLHHPSKSAMADGPTGRGARGVGVWSSFADILMELKPYSPRERDHARRTIESHSRYPETPRRLCYERDETTGLITPFDPEADTLEVVHTLLKQESRPLTAAELLTHWPDTADPVTRTALYETLKHATERGELTREGTGKTGGAFRYGVGKGE